MTDREVYSDEEFALILRKAAEMARREEPSAVATGGLTLAEMKGAAAQAGLDPALVERAARLVRASATASPIERLTGGPLRHAYEIRLPTKLDKAGAERLLSAVRIAAGQAGSRDVGHSSEMGMTWHDGGEMEALGVSARPVEGGTTISVVVDRRGTVVLVGMFSGIVILLYTLFDVFALYPEYPSLGVWPAVAGIGGILAAARGYWAASTKRVRERINDLLTALDQTSTSD